MVRFTRAFIAFIVVVLFIPSSVHATPHPIPTGNLYPTLDYFRLPASLIGGHRLTAEKGPVPLGQAYYEIAPAIEYSYNPDANTGYYDVLIAASPASAASITRKASGIGVVGINCKEVKDDHPLIA